MNLPFGSPPRTRSQIYKTRTIGRSDIAQHPKLDRVVQELSTSYNPVADDPDIPDDISGVTKESNNPEITIEFEQILNRLLLLALRLTTSPAAWMS